MSDCFAEPGVEAFDGVGIRYDISDASSRFRVGFYGPVVGFGVFGGICLGRPLYTLSCELALVLGRPCD
jgi:hypothetical protein